MSRKASTAKVYDQIRNKRKGYPDPTNQICTFFFIIFLMKRLHIYIAMKLRFIKIFKKINIMHLCDERTFIFRQYSGSGSEGWEAKGES
jgi:hypothetical protein